MEESIQTKQGITDLARQIEALIIKYNPVSIVMDAGGLGKKINEELNRRFSLPIRAAEKSRKFEYIELLNDALRTQTFYARETGKFAGDSQLVEWNREKSNGDKLRISDRFHSDICDAVLYAFRESLHFLAEPLVQKAQIGSDEWNRKQIEEMEEVARTMKEAEKLDPNAIGATHMPWKLDE